MNFRTRQQGRATDIVAYTYDAAGRLIGSQHGEQAHRYSVDAAGNRLTSPAQQALPDNRLTQLDDARYRYDGAGNLIERQQPDGERLTMGYDGANRLRLWRDPRRHLPLRRPGPTHQQDCSPPRRHHRHHPLRVGRRPHRPGRDRPTAHHRGV